MGNVTNDCVRIEIKSQNDTDFNFDDASWILEDGWIIDDGAEYLERLSDIIYGLTQMFFR